MHRQLGRTEFGIVILQAIRISKRICHSYSHTGDRTGSGGGLFVYDLLQLVR